MLITKKGITEAEKKSWVTMGKRKRNMCLASNDGNIHIIHIKKNYTTLIYPYLIKLNYEVIL